MATPRDSVASGQTAAVEHWRVQQRVLSRLLKAYRVAGSRLFTVLPDVEGLTRAGMQSSAEKAVRGIECVQQHFRWIASHLVPERIAAFNAEIAADVQEIWIRRDDLMRRSGRSKDHDLLIQGIWRLIIEHLLLNVIPLSMLETSMQIIRIPTNERQNFLTAVTGILNENIIQNLGINCTIILGEEEAMECKRELSPAPPATSSGIGTEEHNPCSKYDVFERNQQLILFLSNESRQKLDFKSSFTDDDAQTISQIRSPELLLFHVLSLLSYIDLDNRKPPHSFMQENFAFGTAILNTNMASSLKLSNYVEFSLQNRIFRYSFIFISVLSAYLAVFGAPLNFSRTLEWSFLPLRANMSRESMGDSQTFLIQNVLFDLDSCPIDQIAYCVEFAVQTRKIRSFDIRAENSNLFEEYGTALSQSMKVNNLTRKDLFISLSIKCFSSAQLSNLSMESLVRNSAQELTVSFFDLVWIHWVLDFQSLYSSTDLIPSFVPLREFWLDSQKLPELGLSHSIGLRGDICPTFLTAFLTDPIIRVIPSAIFMEKSPSKYDWDLFSFLQLHSIQIVSKISDSDAQKHPELSRLCNRRPFCSACSLWRYYLLKERQNILYVEFPDIISPHSPCFPHKYSLSPSDHQLISPLPPSLYP